MPTSTRRFLPQAIVILVLVLALAIAAAAVVLAMGLPGRSTTTSTATVLHWSNEGISDLSTLDPAASPDLNSRLAIQLIFGGLVRFGDHFDILPDAASHWTVSPDGRVYTFYLRPNLKYGTGAPVTAQDVAFSLNRAVSPAFKDRAGKFLLGDIEGVQDVTAGEVASASGIEVLDAHTIRIRLSHPDGSFLAKLANPPGDIVPAWQVAHAPATWYGQAFGTGPFMVSRWVQGDRLLLVPNPYYWAGKVQVDGIDMPFIPEPLVAYKNYRAGTVDIMGLVHFPPEALYEARSLPDFHISTRLETMFVTLNERRPPFDNVRVRQAFAHAVDRAALVREAWLDFAHPTNAMVPPGIVGYNPHLPGTDFNPSLARKLLAEAGYPGGKGLPEITYDVDQDAQSIAQATWLAKQWERVLGVHIRLHQAPTKAVYVDLLRLHDYQIAVIDWSVDFPDPENFLSQQLRTGVPNNNGGWSNATFDRLVDQADAMTPQRKPARLALYHRAESIAMAQAATIPLANPYQGILLQQGIGGFRISGGRLVASNWTRVTAPPGSGP